MGIVERSSDSKDYLMGEIHLIRKKHQEETQKMSLEEKIEWYDRKTKEVKKNEGYELVSSERKGISKMRKKKPR